MKKCPFCAEEIQDDAVVCKHCGRDLENKEDKKEEKKKKSILKSFWFWVFVIVIIISIASGQNPGTSSTSSVVGNQNVSKVIEPPKSNTWNYDKTIDKLTGKERFVAGITGNETLNFEFPYQGGSDLTLFLRHNPDNTNDVILKISKGQFVSSYNSSLGVRFDSGAVEKYGFSEPADYSSDTIFIDNAEKFIQKIRKSKKTIIEVTFYNEGNHAVTFNTEGVQF